MIRKVVVIIKQNINILLTNVYKIHVKYTHNNKGKKERGNGVKSLMFLLKNFRSNLINPYKWLSFSSSPDLNAKRLNTPLLSSYTISPTQSGAHCQHILLLVIRALPLCTWTFPLLFPSRVLIFFLGYIIDVGKETFGISWYPPLHKSHLLKFSLSFLPVKDLQELL